MTKHPIRSKWTAVVAAVASLSLVTACSPSPQPITDVNQEHGTPVGTAAWDAIYQSAVAGGRLQMYVLKTDVSFIQGPIHTSFGVYGNFNLPDRVLLGFSEGPAYVEFYQQGAVVYSNDNGGWRPSQALPKIGVYESYTQLIGAAMTKGIPLERLPDEYVVDEYCSVYRAILPAQLSPPVADWLPAPNASQQSDIQYTFYVGQKDHVLRRVSTTSVAGLPSVGAMQESTETTLFDLDQPIAKIQLPKDLVRQLENTDG